MIESGLFSTKSKYITELIYKFKNISKFLNFVIIMSTENFPFLRNVFKNVQNYFECFDLSRLINKIIKI